MALDAVSGQASCPELYAYAASVPSYAGREYAFADEIKSSDDLVKPLVAAYGYYTLAK